MTNSMMCVYCKTRPATHSVELGFVRDSFRRKFARRCDVCKAGHEAADERNRQESARRLALLAQARGLREQDPTLSVAESMRRVGLSLED